MNESDEYAVEEALALKRQVGGQVAVVSLGLQAGQEAVYKALAKGVDRALRIEASFLNPARTALTLATVLRKEPYDLILTGVESSDVMASYVGAGVAARLRIPFAFAVTGIEFTNEKKLIVTKEIGGGTSKKVEMPLPAVLSVQSGIRPLTYTAYSRIVLSRRRPVEIIKLKDLRIEGELQDVPEWVIEKVFVPEGAVERSIVMLEGTPLEAARSLTKIVKNKIVES